ncbi:MAG: TetR/AcrR family transcriptional regulator [Alphaproteobacteria bacterium]|nr:TetR/AcrR family transcriptional regulator [Alphaproteobacteria bacterium]
MATFEPPLETDGRRLRAVRSRDQIVEAMLALVGEGEMNPSAAQVAERARVGLRSVFRHYEDMDALYCEMSARIEAEILPLISAPFQARDWRGRLGELLARRAQIYERLMPFRVAGAVRRFQSAYLMQDQARMRALETETLRAIVPRSIIGDAALFASLDLAAGFEAWRALRQDQGLPRKRAEEAVRRLVEGLVGQL